MKRVYKQILFVLLMLLCLSVCSFSLAAESLRVQGISDKTFNTDARKKVPTKWSLLFKENYPSVKLSMTVQTKEQTTEALLKKMKASSINQDVFVMDSAVINTESIFGEGYCVDLGQYEELAAIFAQMHPSIVNAASFDDKIFGMPISISPHHYFSYDAYGWQEAGFTKEDVPTSFMGFLDFLERWVERIKVQPTNKFCISDVFDTELYNANSYAEWLVNLLNANYERQCEYQGVELDVKAPFYIALVDRIERIGELLYKYDNIMEGRGLFAERAGFNEALNQFVSLRITDDDPVLITSSMTMLCINSNSKNLKSAVSFIENYMESMMNHHIEDYTKQNDEDSEMAVAYASLFSSATEAVPGQNFGYADLYRGWIERNRAGISDESLALKTRKMYEEDLPVLEYELALILNGGEYIFSIEQLQAYQTTIVHALWFPITD
jgi:hypothetical protein